jgi:Galactose mutarotase and related enzymes
MRALTGEQFELTRTAGDRPSRAIITEVAAGLRLLEIDGVELTESYSESTVPPFGAGIVLAPWPNRIRDGRWLLDGAPQQLDLTEVDKNNALHGLLRTRPYRVVEREAHAIVLAATVHPQHGYPFLVDTTVRYELVDDGLTVTHGFTNAGEAAAPVAVGAHPFFRVGSTPIEELTLTLAAATRFVTDDRLNPIGQEPVDGTAYDFRTGVRVGELDLDDAFGGVLPGADGVARHRLTASDGRYTEVWQGPDFGFVQMFTPRRFPRPTKEDPMAKGLAIAIEPMTAPPDAFNSGLGVIWLQPGQSWSGSWGVTHGRH